MCVCLVRYYLIEVTFQYYLLKKKLILKLVLPTLKVGHYLANANKCRNTYLCRKMTHCPVGFAAAFMCSLETSQGDEESERGGDDVRRVSENDSTGFAAGETDFFYIYFEEEGEKMGVMMAMTMCTAILYIQLVDCCVHKYTLDLVGLRGA